MKLPLEPKGSKWKSRSKGLSSTAQLPLITALNNNWLGLRLRAEGRREGQSRDKPAHMNPGGYLLGFEGRVETHSGPNVRRGDSECAKCGEYSKQSALLVSTPSSLSTPNPRKIEGRSDFGPLHSIK